MRGKMLAWLVAVALMGCGLSASVAVPALIRSVWYSKMGALQGDMLQMFAALKADTGIACSPAWVPVEPAAYGVTEPLSIDGLTFRRQKQTHDSLLLVADRDDTELVRVQSGRDRDEMLRNLNHPAYNTEMRQHIRYANWAAGGCIIAGVLLAVKLLAGAVLRHFR